MSRPNAQSSRQIPEWSLKMRNRSSSMSGGEFQPYLYHPTPGRSGPQSTPVLARPLVFGNPPDMSVRRKPKGSSNRLRPISPVGSQCLSGGSGEKPECGHCGQSSQSRRVVGKLVERRKALGISQKRSRKLLACCSRIFRVLNKESMSSSYPPLLHLLG